MINVIAANSDGSTGSPSMTVALAIPSSGVASRHSEVVTAGRLRFTIVIAQLANAVQMMPLNNNSAASLRGPHDARRAFSDKGDRREQHGRQKHLPEHQLKRRRNPSVRPDVDDVAGPAERREQDQAAADTARCGRSSSASAD